MNIQRLTPLLYGHREFPPPFSEFFNINENRSALKKAASAYGTPLFIIDRHLVEVKYGLAAKALRLHWGNYIIAFSFKTNYFLAQSNVLRQLGAWAEVVSEKEYRMAKRAGYSAKKIIYNGPVKRNEELLRAFKEGALVHIDNVDELIRANEIAKKLRKKIAVGIRINTSSSGLKSRFGFFLENGEAWRALGFINKSKYLSLHVPP